MILGMPWGGVRRLSSFRSPAVRSNISLRRDGPLGTLYLTPYFNTFKMFGAAQSL